LKKGGFKVPKLDILNVSGEKVDEIELNDSVFGAEINEHVLYEAVKNYLANQRQGTQSAKTRAEVRGGGRKPWKQKGTGRARAGSTRQPNWVGGGVVFAPKPRDYSYKIPKKMKRAAMKSALTSKVALNELIVLDELMLEAPKTKEMISILANVKAGRKPIIIMDDSNANVIKSSANIPGVQTTYVGRMNVYEILNSDSCIITKEAAKKIEEVYA